MSNVVEGRTSIQRAAVLFDGVPASQVTFELSEDVTGFDASDVPTDNGSLSRSSAIDG